MVLVMKFNAATDASFLFIFGWHRLRLTSVTLYFRLMGYSLPFLVDKIEQAGGWFFLFSEVGAGTVWLFCPKVFFRKKCVVHFEGN